MKFKTKSNKFIKKYCPNDYKNLYESKQRSETPGSNYNTNNIAIMDNVNDTFIVFIL